MKYEARSFVACKLRGGYLGAYQSECNSYVDDLDPKLDKDDHKWVITTAIAMAAGGNLKSEHIIEAINLLEVGIRRALWEEARGELSHVEAALLKKQEKGEPLDD